MKEAFIVVEQFEKAVADFSGSKYAVAVDSCTNALFLSLMYMKQTGMSLPTHITIPKRTYISVPSTIIHAGFSITFEDAAWSGVYQLKPLPVYDGATRFRRNMYIKDSLHCLSFHMKKHIKIGRGGMILTDNKDAVEWLKLARFNGRNPVYHDNDTFKLIGWNMYMPSYDAARGLWLMATTPETDLDIQGDYPDLSLYNFNGNASGGRLIKRNE